MMIDDNSKDNYDDSDKCSYNDNDDESHCGVASDDDGGDNSDHDIQAVKNDTYSIADDN